MLLAVFGTPKYDRKCRAKAPVTLILPEDIFISYFLIKTQFIVPKFNEFHISCAKALSV
jgi:hypothetical protein